MNSNDTLLKNLPDPFASDVPCCGEELAVGDATEGLPDPAALQQELDLLADQTGAVSDELIFADVGSEELAFQQELELAGLTNEPLPPIEDILKIAERYPGLKVTFSF
ncbi:MAG TPA: hypothetical protein VLI39_00130 [Sedimentisphaerales bacterium]|nr:hypothetical protein [Sedimentisphaerales bacterium]